MAMNKAYLTCGRTAESDECLTPRYAVYPIIKYLKAKGFKTILCPFDKDDSFYVRVLKKEGFTVINSHLETKSFFSYTVDDIKNIDCIVSNPPFSCKDAVLEKLYEFSKPFMILLPQNSLQSKRRTQLFINNGLEYLGFDSRICFYTISLESLPKGNHFASGYFCHNVLPEKLIFEHLELVDEPYNIEV